MSAQVALEVGAVGTTPAAQAALDAYAARQRRSPQPYVAPQHSLEARLLSTAVPARIRGVHWVASVTQQERAPLSCDGAMPL